MRGLLKLTLWLVPLTLIGLVAIRLAASPGAIALNWGGYDIETSLMFALFAMLGVFVVLAGLWRGFSWLKNWPARMMQARMVRKKRDADYAVARGMLALAGGLGAQAEAEAVRARKALPDATLSLMLSAQAARLSGAQEAEETYYRQLVQDDQGVDAQLVGLRGLFHLAIGRGGVGDAALHAERALSLSKDKKRRDWALEGLFQIEAYKGDWTQARKRLDGFVKAGGLKKSHAKRRRAVLMLAEAQTLVHEETSEAQAVALDLCQRALRLAPDLVPAYGLAAQLAAHSGNAQKKNWARRVERHWRGHPHPELADAYLALYPERTLSQKLTAMQKLTAKNKGENASRFALAEAAIGAQRWSVARTALGSSLESGLDSGLDSSLDEAQLAHGDSYTQKYCLLMADIELGENADTGAARSWKTRALTARADACWVSPTGRVGAWQAVCRDTGAFDAYEWRRPEHAAISTAISALSAKGGAAVDSFPRSAKFLAKLRQN